MPDTLRASGVGWYGTTVGLSGLVASGMAGMLWDHVGHAAVFVYGAAIRGDRRICALLPSSRQPSVQLKGKHHDLHDSSVGSRRAALVASLGIALALPGCSLGGGSEEDASAVEDLMREHGVVRRVTMFVLSRGGTDPPARPRSASMRLHWETRRAWFARSSRDYHEALLEERHVFPAVRKLGGEAARRWSTPCCGKHRRGREITDFIRSRCASGKIATGRCRAAGAGARKLFTHVRRACCL